MTFLPRGLVFALVLRMSGEAFAMGVNVNPIQIYLSPAAKSAVLAIRNDGTEETRYQVTVFGWDESSEGGMVLTPTNEIVFFPKLLALKPGEQRNVRVGTAGALG